MDVTRTQGERIEHVLFEAGGELSIDVIADRAMMSRKSASVCAAKVAVRRDAPIIRTGKGTYIHRNHHPILVFERQNAERSGVAQQKQATPTNIVVHPLPNPLPTLPDATVEVRIDGLGLGSVAVRVSAAQARNFLYSIIGG